LSRNNLTALECQQLTSQVDAIVSTRKTQKHSATPCVLFSPAVKQPPVLRDYSEIEISVNDSVNETQEVPAVEPPVDEKPVETKIVVNYESSPEPLHKSSSINKSREDIDFETEIENAMKKVSSQGVSDFNESPILPDTQSPGYDQELELEIENIFEEMKSTQKTAQKTEPSSLKGKRVSSKVLETIMKHSPNVERRLFMDGEHIDIDLNSSLNSEADDSQEITPSEKLFIETSPSLLTPTRSSLHLRLRQQNLRWTSTPNLKSPMKRPWSTPGTPSSQAFTPDGMDSPSSVNSSGSKKEVFRATTKATADSKERRLYLTPSAKDLTIKKRRKLLRAKKLVCKIQMSTLQVTIDGDWFIFETGKEPITVRIDQEREKFLALLTHYVMLADDQKEKSPFPRPPRIQYWDASTPDSPSVELLMEQYKDLEPDDVVERESVRAKEHNSFSPMLIMNMYAKQGKISEMYYKEGEFLDVSDEFS
jgi:hypothetical protein